MSKIRVEMPYATVGTQVNAETAHVSGGSRLPAHSPPSSGSAAPIAPAIARRRTSGSAVLWILAIAGIVSGFLVAGGLVLTLKGILAPLTITVGKMTVSTSSIGATIAALGAGCVFLTSREILRTTRRERSSR